MATADAAAQAAWPSGAQAALMQECLSIMLTFHITEFNWLLGPGPIWLGVVNTAPHGKVRLRLPLKTTNTSQDRTVRPHTARIAPKRTNPTSPRRRQQKRWKMETPGAAHPTTRQDLASFASSASRNSSLELHAIVHVAHPAHVRFPGHRTMAHLQLDTISPSSTPTTTVIQPPVSRSSRQLQQPTLARVSTQQQRRTARERPPSTFWNYSQ